MRLLAVTWGISDYRGGGEAIGAHELVRHLAELGVTVDVVTPLAEYRGPVPEGVNLHVVRGDVRVGMTGLNKARMIRRAKRLVRAHDYDAMHVVSQFTSWPALMRPFVMSGCHRPQGGPLPGPSAHLKQITQLGGAELASKLAEIPLSVWLERVRGVNREWTLRNVDHIVIRQGAGVGAYEEYAPTTFIPFGVDTEAFTPDESVEKEPLVVFAGNFREYKRPLHLVEALAVLAERGVDFKAVLCGEGPLRAPAEEKARASGIAERVDFPGHYPREKITGLFRRASAFCLPSWFEPGGLVNLEAMACGTAPVTSDSIVAAHDYIAHGVSGYLVDKDSVPALADALEHLVTDAARARRMGRAARESAERFSWREVARRHVALYEDLAAGRGAPPRARTRPTGTRTF